MVTWVGWYDTGCCFDGAALGRSGGEGQEPIFSINCFWCIGTDNIVDFLSRVVSGNISYSEKQKAFGVCMNNVINGKYGKIHGGDGGHWSRVHYNDDNLW